MDDRRAEIEATMARYLEVRAAIDAGRGTWADLAAFFTEDAVFIDPAWGRVEGLDEMRRTVFGDAMDGLEEWKFPVDFWAVTGDTIIVKWRQILPGRRADGRPYEQSGISTIVYAGDGKFCYEEDLLNMVHVFEDMKASRCAVPSVAVPPARVNRDFSVPDA